MLTTAEIAACLAMWLLFVQRSLNDRMLLVTFRSHPLPMHSSLILFVTPLPAVQPTFNQCSCSASSAVMFCGFSDLGSITLIGRAVAAYGLSGSPRHVPPIWCTLFLPFDSCRTTLRLLNMHSFGSLQSTGGGMSLICTKFD